MIVCYNHRCTTCKDKNSCTVTLIIQWQVALVLCTTSPSNIRCPIMSTWHDWKNTFHNLNERTNCRDSTNLNAMHLSADSLLCRVDKHFLQSHDSYNSTTITWGLLLTSQATKLLSPLDEMPLGPHGQCLKNLDHCGTHSWRDWCFFGGVFRAPVSQWYLHHGWWVHSGVCRGRCDNS